MRVYLLVACRKLLNIHSCSFLTKMLPQMHWMILTYSCDNYFTVSLFYIILSFYTIQALHPIIKEQNDIRALWLHVTVCLCHLPVSDVDHSVFGHRQGEGDEVAPTEHIRDVSACVLQEGETGRTLVSAECCIILLSVRGTRNPVPCLTAQNHKGVINNDDYDWWHVSVVSLRIG